MFFGQIRLVSFCLLLSFTAVVTRAQEGQTLSTPDVRPTPTPYKMLRQDEDWGVMRDPSRRSDWSDKLKYIQLGAHEGWYVSVGGEARPYYERYRNEEWGSAPQDLSGYFLQRYMLHADFHFGESVRFFGQLKSGIETGKRGGPGPPDEDLLDVHQAFLDLVWNFSRKRSLTLRAGRQELNYGSGRLISMREGPNVRQSFDGAVLMLRAGAWRVDGFVVKPVETDAGFFDDAAVSSHTLWGAYAVRPLPRLLPGGNIDLYYIGLDRLRARFDQGREREIRQTVGTRLSGERRGWDYNAELVYQFGNFGRGNIRAWTVASDAGGTLRSVRMSPRLGFKANVTSGDRDPNNPDLGTFNPLFPKGAYFGQLASIGPLNHRDLHPTLDLTFPRGVTLTADWVFYWRQSTRDGLYGIPGNLLRTGQLSSARFIGHQPGVEVRWRVNRHIDFTVNYARFLAGRFLRETPPGEDTTFFAAWVTYRF